MMLCTPTNVARTMCLAATLVALFFPSIWEWAQKLRSSMEKNIVFAPRGADGESEQKVADAGRAFCEMVKDYAP